MREPGHATRTAIHRVPPTYIITNTHNSQRCTIASKFRRCGFGGHLVPAVCPANGLLSPMRSLEVSRYTTWQRLVHSVPRGERIAAAVMMETIKTNPITVPWPGDATPPGTLALAVRCHTVNVSIGVFLSDRYLFCRSDKRQLPLETIGNLVQNTIRGGTGTTVQMYIGVLLSTVL